MKYLVLVVAVFFYFDSHASDHCINPCDVNAEPSSAQIVASKPLVPSPQTSLSQRLENQLNLSIQLDNEFESLNPQLAFQLHEKINEFDDVVSPEKVWADCSVPLECNDFLLIKDSAHWQELTGYLTSQSDSIDIKTTAIDYMDYGRIFFGQFTLSIDPSTELSDTNQISKRFMVNMPVVTRYSEKTNIVFNIGSALHLPSIIRTGSSSFTPTGNALITLLAEPMEVDADEEYERYTLIHGTIKPGENRIFHLSSLPNVDLEHGRLVRFVLTVDLQVTADHGVYHDVGYELNTSIYSSTSEYQNINSENSGGGALTPLLLLLFGLIRFANRYYRSIRSQP
jgi:hypothetical protein